MLGQRVIAPSPIAHVEEPEAHLHKTLMDPLARVLCEAVLGDGGTPDVDQLWVATHHHLFAISEEFFDVSLDGAGSTQVEKRPREEAILHFYEPHPYWETSARSSRTGGSPLTPFWSRTSPGPSARGTCSRLCAGIAAWRTVTWPSRRGRSSSPWRRSAGASDVRARVARGRQGDPGRRRVRAMVRGTAPAGRRIPRAEPRTRGRECRCTRDAEESRWSSRTTAAVPSGRSSAARLGRKRKRSPACSKGRGSGSTRAAHESDALEVDLASFGRRAHEAGVRVFAGHCGDVRMPPPHPALQRTVESVYEGLRGAFVAFLEGQHDAAALRDAALAGVPLGRAALIVSPLLHEALKTLRVLP